MGVDGPATIDDAIVAGGNVNFSKVNSPVDRERDVEWQNQVQVPTITVVVVHSDVKVEDPQTGQVLTLKGSSVRYVLRHLWEVHSDLAIPVTVEPTL